MVILVLKLYNYSYNFVSKYLDMNAADGSVCRAAQQLGGVKSQSEIKSIQAAALKSCSKSFCTWIAAGDRELSRTLLVLSMCITTELKVEALSSLFGQTLKLYDKARRQLQNRLFLEDVHLSIVTQRQTQMREFFIDVEDFFDPRYDYDFTNLSDRSRCWRGGEEYERPMGWYRIALKVKGKYPDGDAWLGTAGWRSYSVEGEWPACYHGTTLSGAKGIVRSHYKAGDRGTYGRGIYSTPEIHVAEREEFARTFTSVTTGKRYKVILQNRINPDGRQICQRSDYWLIPIPEGTTPWQEQCIVEASIRPYGILIREV